MGIGKRSCVQPIQWSDEQSIRRFESSNERAAGLKKALIDCMLSALYQLQAFYLNEIRRGLAGMGEYHLTEEYATIQMCHESHDAIKYIPCSNPADIVQKIWQSSALEVHYIHQWSTGANRNQGKLEHLIYSCLCKILNWINFDQKLHVFKVKGSSGITQVVTVFSHESCSCPLNSGCYHILASCLCKTPNWMKQHQLWPKATCFQCEREFWSHTGSDCFQYYTL